MKKVKHIDYRALRGLGDEFKMDCHVAKAPRNDKGRSMTEMLGVLAIIGVLSIAGVGGYRAAINKHKANQVIYDVGLGLAELKSMDVFIGETEIVAPFTPSSGLKTFLWRDDNANDVVLVNAISKATCERLKDTVSAEGLKIFKTDDEATLDTCTDDIDLMFTFDASASANVERCDSPDESETCCQAAERIWANNACCASETQNQACCQKAGRTWTGGSCCASANASEACCQAANGATYHLIGGVCTTCPATTPYWTGTDCQTSEITCNNGRISNEFCISNTGMTWSDAVSYCVVNGRRLASMYEICPSWDGIKTGVGTCAGLGGSNQWCWSSTVDENELVYSPNIFDSYVGKNPKHYLDGCAICK